jgi:predicted ribosomally synthesized peptide with nif11-like leader
VYLFGSSTRLLNIKQNPGAGCGPNGEGGNMSIEDARNFVEKMREDLIFRGKVLQTKNPEDLALFLRGEQMQFDQRELAGAMAECMGQMEQQMAG